MDLTYNIKEIRAGNESEFRKLIDENMDYIYMTTFRIAADEEDTRDIVQDTFLKVWEKRKSIKDNKSVTSYIRRIAVNKCYDLLRRRKIMYGTNRTDNEYLMNEIVGNDRADYKLNNDEATLILNTLVSRLSPRQRIVFTMVEIEELSHDEVAEITGMSKNSIKSNLRHARKKLEGFITKYLN